MKYCLLDYIAQQIDAHYLSELKNKGLMRAYDSYIQKITADDFSFEDWKDTCEYLTGSNEQINTKEDAKNKILHWLQS